MTDLVDGPAGKDQAKARFKAKTKDKIKAKAKRQKELIKALSPAQRDQLMRRLKDVGVTLPSEVHELAPTPRGGDVPVPLSFAQERAWFRAQLAPADPAHILAGAIHFDGSLSIPALEASLTAIVGRHETLRAHFRSLDGQPEQVIAEPTPFPLRLVDLSGLEAGQAETISHRLYHDETRRPFDLGLDLLLRATLLQRAVDDHLLLISMHHIASDGWSIGVAMGEMATLYHDFATAGAPSLPPLPVQYGDVAAWQRQRLDDQAIETHVEYWRAQLADVPPPLALPDDPPRAVSADTSAKAEPSETVGATASLRIDRALKEGLEQVSRGEDTTLFVTTLTAFLVLLMRLTGREDLVVGSPVSGRSRVETEALVGLFVNTLVVRAHLPPALSAREAIGRVRTSTLEGLAHGELPFERIVQAVAPERSSGSHPLFDIVFNLTPSPPRSLSLPGVHGRFVAPPGIGAKFSMELYVTEWQGALELKLVFPARRYTERRMNALLAQLESILRQIVEDPSQAIGMLDLVTPSAATVLPDPTTLLEAPAQTPIVETIHAWVARQPGHPALEQAGTIVTYAELGRCMDDLAGALCDVGFEPGAPVAVLGPRCPGVVAAMAGCLQAGGVLLTLSHDLPEERQRVMIAEAGARHLVHVDTPRTEDAWISTLGDLEVLSLRSDGTLVQRRSPDSEAAAPTISASDSAYIFFTSGSTGTPKAILGTHAGLAHFLQWQRQTFVVEPDDRCAQLTGLSFDVVLRDVFLPLTAGATLVLPPKDVAVAAPDTVVWLEQAHITRTHTVPSVAESWLLAPPATCELAGLRTVFFAGEPLTDSLVDRWRRAFPRAGALINLYGPTETTLAKCFYEVPEPPHDGAQPLGHTMPNAQALVLNAHGRACGIGEPGEIFIRTPFRSHGYLNAPDETTARFRTNPFREYADDLLYSTGDRGFFDTRGRLRFLGRLDHQVKVRGVRVEPTEVAMALERCADVAACAVIAREDGTNGPMLVAYVVSDATPVPTAGALQSYLQQHLPAPMIPAAFVFLDRLPLTANHKLDRDRLPPPEHEADDEAYVAPRTATELRLVQIWEQLLDVRPIGVTANFFEIGGHSLMALHLLMETDKALDLKIELHDFLAQPTIEAVAAATQDADSPQPLAIPLWSADHPSTLFVVHPGGGTLLNYVHLVRHLAAETSVVGLQAQGLDGRAAPHANLEQMAAAYVEEVRRRQPTGPYLLAGHSLGGVIAFEMACQLEDRGNTVALLALIDAGLEPADPRTKSEQHVSDEDARRLADMISTIERFVGRAIDISFEGLRGLSPDAQIEQVVQALEVSEAMPHGTGIEQTRNMLAVSKAHLEARRGYKPRRTSVPITLLRAAEEIPKAEDETLGWGTLTDRFVQRTVPGDHVTMMREPHVAGVAEALRVCITTALASTDPDGGDAATTPPPPARANERDRAPSG